MKIVTTVLEEQICGPLGWHRFVHLIPVDDNVLCTASCVMDDDVLFTESQWKKHGEASCSPMNNLENGTS